MWVGGLGFQSLISDVVEQLAGTLLVRMLHTRDGARVASLCVAAGSAKVHMRSFITGGWVMFTKGDVYKVWL